MQALDFGDYLVISDSDRDVFISSREDISGSDNLAILARDLFRSKSGISNKFSIFLQKNVPIGAGLGGGSSNAATVLFGLNQLCETGFSDEELKSWSSELGADIPFFFSSGRAMCKGGQNLSVNDFKDDLLGNKKIFLVFPPGPGTLTKEIYKKFVFNCIRYEEKLLLGHNDLESTVFSYFPFLRDLKRTLMKSLGDFSELIFMTGSGSTFVIFTDYEERVSQELMTLSLDFVLAEPILRKKTPSQWFCVPHEEAIFV